MSSLKLCFINTFLTGKLRFGSLCVLVAMEGVGRCIHEGVGSCMHTCDMTHSNAWHDSLICVTRCVMSMAGHAEWRRLIGSPKLQIIFHKRAIKYRSLLRKMTCKDKGSYESSPPCMCVTCIMCDEMCDVCHETR